MVESHRPGRVRRSGHRLGAEWRCGRGAYGDSALLVPIAIVLGLAAAAPFLLAALSPSGPHASTLPAAFAAMLVAQLLTFFSESSTRGLVMLAAGGSAWVWWATVVAVGRARGKS